MELISFKLCPFVQRAVITLLEKEADFTITYINLDAPPAEFAEISPLGKVPLLKTRGTVLFESAVICEYVDETIPPSLHPGTPLHKAQNRAWIEFASECLMLQHQFYTAPDAASGSQARQNLKIRLGQLEQALAHGPYFNGEAFSLADAAYAPLFMRFALLGHYADFYADLPKIHVWQANLLERDSVRNSVADDFSVLFHDYLRRKGSFLDL